MRKGTEMLSTHSVLENINDIFNDRFTFLQHYFVVLHVICNGMFEICFRSKMNFINNTNLLKYVFRLNWSGEVQTNVFPSSSAPTWRETYAAITDLGSESFWKMEL